MTDESNLEDQLRDVLGRAARRLDVTAPPWTSVDSRKATEGRRLRWPRYRVRAGSLAVMFAAGVTIAIAIVGLTSLHAGGGGSPPAGQPPVVTPPRSPLAGLSPQRRNAILNGLMTARQETMRIDPSCRLSRLSLGGSRKAPSGSPPAAALAAFSVLRRPATQTDRAGAELATTEFARRFEPYIHDVRFLETRAGVRYYIVPAQQVGIGVPPARCDRQELNVMTHELAHAPAVKRSASVDVARQYLAYQRRLETAPAGVCVTGTGECVNPITLAFTGAAVSTSGVGGSKTTLLTAIVPDGPARITLDIPGGTRTPHGQTPPPLTVTIPVTHNLAIAALPITYTELAISPSKVIWRNAKGRVLKIFELDSTDG